MLFSGNGIFDRTENNAIKGNGEIDEKSNVFKLER